jgi:oligoendopeptidase F
MQNTITIPTRSKRKFVPKNLIIDSWNKLKFLFDNLVERKISSATELEQWMLDRSELITVIGDEIKWSIIKNKIDTTDKELAERFLFWIKEIEPNMDPYEHKLNLKLVESPYLKELDQEKYRIYLRGVKNNIEIFREDNIPLNTTMKEKEQEYGTIIAKMSIEVDGEKLTMQKAEHLLKNTDRKKREEIYNKLTTRRLKDEKALDDLFDELIVLRQKIARNAGFNNYRDYMFAYLGRFDYTPKDCFNFHDAIAKEIVPIINSFEQKRKDKLGYKSYKPWDLFVDINGFAPLKPFEGGDELTDLSVECLNRLRPYFGECLSKMKEIQHLDLESKDGKSSGNFQMPLDEIGVPFIYMNAVGSQSDLVFMIHEVGHAVHSFLSRNLSLIEFKHPPAEVNELASMSMELLSMDHWDVFYKDKAELKRAKIKKLEQALKLLPWFAYIDKFQHWIYTTEHTAQQRKEKWLTISSELGNQILDWEGNENAHANLWQNQQHLYEMPFYYIEYGMAQLGAIAMWRSYKQLGEQALDNFMEALKLGYTKTIREIYETAGIKFDFSASYVKELAEFIKDELEKSS